LRKRARPEASNNEPKRSFFVFMDDSLQVAKFWFIDQAY
jgi:hypothetical protein